MDDTTHPLLFDLLRRGASRDLTQARTAEEQARLDEEKARLAEESALQAVERRREERVSAHERLTRTLNEFRASEERRYRDEAERIRQEVARKYADARERAVVAEERLESHGDEIVEFAVRAIFQMGEPATYMAAQLDDFVERGVAPRSTLGEFAVRD